LAFIGRIIVIIFALFGASIATGFAIAIGILGLEWNGYTGNIVERIWFWLLVFFGAGLAGAVSLLPITIGIAIAESIKIRSLVAYAAAGAAMLAFGYYSSGLSTRYQESIDRPPPPISHELEVAGAAGAVFGFAYWLLAGRNAGRWRER
jgi:hypothetical protein